MSYDTKRRRGAKKPDQSGATSRMWINGARPQTREQPLVTTEKISNRGEDPWTVIRRRSDMLIYYGEYIPEWLYAIATEKVSN